MVGDWCSIHEKLVYSAVDAPCCTVPKYVRGKSALNRPAWWCFARIFLEFMPFRLLFAIRNAILSYFFLPRSVVRRLGYGYPQCLSVCLIANRPRPFPLQICCYLIIGLCCALSLALSLSLSLSLSLAPLALSLTLLWFRSFLGVTAAPFRGE